MKRVVAPIAALLAAAGLLAAPCALAQEPDGSTRERRRDHVTEEQHRRDLERAMVAARRELETAVRRMQELRTKLATMEAGREARHDVRILRDRKARIGVVVDTAAGGPRHPEGAVIVAITPGSSAEEAGLLPGDVVVRMNGEGLEPPPGTRSSGVAPHALELIRRAGELEPGDRVTLDVKRGEDVKSVTLEARPAEARGFWFTPGFEIPVFAFEEWTDTIEDPDPVPEQESLRKWLELELVALNPELGRYFGSSKGVLVVHTPEDPPFAVQAGDVLIGIGDRELTTPLQTLRILHSFRPGEPVELKVLRNRDVVMVKAQAPVMRAIVQPRTKPPGD